VHWLSRISSTRPALIVQNIHVHPPSQPPPPPPGVLRLSIPSASHCSWSPNLRRRCGLACGSIGLVQVLGLALLAVLPFVNHHSVPIASSCTYHPLGELELGLASSLGSDPLVLLEGAADGARCDRNVAVVAVQRVRTGCNCDFFAACKGRRAYERPAAFHANAIVMVGGVGSGVAVVGRWSLRLLKGCCTESSRMRMRLGGINVTCPDSHPPSIPLSFGVQVEQIHVVVLMIPLNGHISFGSVALHFIEQYLHNVGVSI
jgi:hypothetical protein